MIVSIKEEKPPEAHSAACSTGKYSTLKKVKLNAAGLQFSDGCMDTAICGLFLRLETEIWEHEECDFPHGLEGKGIAPVCDIYLKDWQEKTWSSKADLFFSVQNGHFVNLKVHDGSQLTFKAQNTIGCVQFTNTVWKPWVPFDCSPSASE